MQPKWLLQKKYRGVLYRFYR